MEGTNGSGADLRRFGVFELDLRAGELRRNGMKVKLQEQPFQVLTQLLEKPGEVITREDIRNRLWPADTFVDFDHSLNAAIRRLRDALGDSAENPTFVETVARRGYRFLAPVTSTMADDAAGPIAIDRPNSEPPARPALHFHLWWIIAGFASVVLILLGIRLGFLLAQRHYLPAPAQLRVTRLTANPADDRVRAAAISRDGKYLAFSDETGFYLRQIDTGETHPVILPTNTVAEFISWFPDGAHMVVALIAPAQASGLWEISTLGGSPRKLSDNGRAPAVSPDGKAIAFVAGQRLHEQIWVMAADGSQPRQLVGEEGDIFGSPAWSPDGSKLAYTRGKNFYTSSVRGTIEFVDLQSQRVRSLFQVTSAGWFATLDGPLAWTPDGRLIYRLSEPPPRQLDSNLWSIALDRQGKVTGEPQRLTSDPGAVSSISISADGKRVAYLKGVPEPDVYVAQLDGQNFVSEPVRLTLDDRQDIPFDWTPDGKAVIFVSDRTGTFNLYRQATDQTVPELLVGGNQPIMTPRLSPDGSQLLYLVFPGWSDNATPASLMRMPLAGGAPQPVLESKWLTNQQCSRAPATLCLYSTVSEGVFTLFSFDPFKGSGTQVYRIKDDIPQAYNWTLSPDASTLAIAKGKEGAQEPRIHLISLKTGAEKWLTIQGWTGVEALDWAADGKSLWASSAGEEENTLLNIDLQGHARPLWHPRKKTVYWAIPSRDGKSLALHVSSSSANVWMVER
jgi:Tol biopolymer transport system component/DNA-binding winged helix-turn-helix (wHTH) protein